MAPYVSNGHLPKVTASYVPLEAIVRMRVYRHVHAHVYVHHMTHLKKYKCPQSDKSFSKLISYVPV